MVQRQEDEEMRCTRIGGVRRFHLCMKVQSWMTFSFLFKHDTVCFKPARCATYIYTIMKFMIYVYRLTYQHVYIFYLELEFSKTDKIYSHV